MTVLLSRLWILTLCLATAVGCAYTNVKVDDDDHPVFNTGVGATILYPGQTPAMPPTHPGQRLPSGAPAPGAPAAGGPQSQTAPSPGTTLGGAPTTTTQQGPGSSATSSNGGGVTFIGGSGIEEKEHNEYRQEPTWLKYLLAPFAIAAYPFVAVWKAATGDEGPPPTRTTAAPTESRAPTSPPVDVQTQYEQSQLEALEQQLAQQPGSQTVPPGPAPRPKVARPAPASSSIASELAALQRGIPPRERPSSIATARSEPEVVAVRERVSDPGDASQRVAVGEPSPVVPQASAPAQTAGIADQVSDRNGDGRPDQWVYRDGQRIVRELFDEDADGVPDRSIFYDPETGEKRMEEEDTTLDGRLDSWIEYQNGQLARHRRDTNADGFLDTWSFYRAGQLSRQERDLNADGFRDRIAFYDGGRLVREEEDRNGDGRPDLLSLFDEQERIRQRDEDRDGDGIVDMRSIYEEGRLVRRELLSEDLDERIEEDELASAAWSSGKEGD